MIADAEPEASSARAWLACGLIVAAAIVLIGGLLVLDSESKAALGWVVAPAVALVAVAAALTV